MQTMQTNDPEDLEKACFVQCAAKSTVAGLPLDRGILAVQLRNAKVLRAAAELTTRRECHIRWSSGPNKQPWLA